VFNWFIKTAESAAGSPVVQGLIAAFCTFILEDPTTVGSGLLVAEGKMNYYAAFLGLSLGIAAGDFGLYWLGRLAQGRVFSFIKVDQEKVISAGSWYNRNLASAIFGSRFLPGMRLPMYLAAGLLKVPPWRFLFLAVAASVLWTVVLLYLTIHIGGAVLEKANSLKWPLGLGLVLLIAGVQTALARRRRQRRQPNPAPSFGIPAQSNFEFWPPILFYLPVAVYYFWLAIRFKGLMLPTAANPCMYSGGMLMESKDQIMSLVPENQRHLLPRWAALDLPEAPLSPHESGSLAAEAMAARGVSFPLVVKPDAGQRGLGVRPVGNLDELQAYLAVCQPGARLILQERVPWDQEMGIFYYRRPNESQGVIFSVTLKCFPAVLGDGTSTLRELILNHPRASIKHKLFFRRHRRFLDTVIPEGQRYPLIFAGSHSQGAVFLNGNKLVTPEMIAAIHDFASALPEFYFGRFDVRCRSWDSLRQGRDFSIVEINGASAEATCVWDPRTRLSEAYRTLFKQFRILFEIGAANRDRGFQPMSPLVLIKDFLKYRQHSRQFPPTL
jgi:membrane protein DedA with SNARE-associated domain